MFANFYSAYVNTDIGFDVCLFEFTVIYDELLGRRFHAIYDELMMQMNGMKESKKYMTVVSLSLSARCSK